MLQFIKTVRTYINRYEKVYQMCIACYSEPIFLQCKQCQSLLKEVMAQDRMMAELKRDIRSLEVLINKKFGVKLNLRTTRELRLRDRPGTIEIKPYVPRQEKLKVCMSPRAKFARLRELRQRAPARNNATRTYEDMTDIEERPHTAFSSPMGME